MKVLENRTVDSKREMDILDALQDIRARNARNERVGQAVDLVARVSEGEVEDEETAERQRLEDEDEKLVREVFSQVAVPAPGADATTVVTVKRKADDTEPTLQSLLPESTRALISSSSLLPAAKKKKTEGKNSLGIRVVKKAKVKS